MGMLAAIRSSAAAKEARRFRMNPGMASGPHGIECCGLATLLIFGPAWKDGQARIFAVNASVLAGYPVKILSEEFPRRLARAFSVPIESERRLYSLFWTRFLDANRPPTSLENALAVRNGVAPLENAR